MKHIGLLAVAAVLTMNTVAAPAPSDTLKKIKENGKIVIAHRESSVPFSFVDGSKQPMGYTVDLCARVAEAVKRELKMPALKVEYVQVAPAERIPSIRDGKADLECGNTTNTPARRNDVDFAITTFVAAGRVMTTSGTAPSSWAEMSGMSVATTSGSTYEKLLKDQNDKFAANIKTVIVKDNAEAMATLDSGKAQAWINDDTVLFAARAQHANPGKFSVSARSLTIEPLAIMFRRDDAAFKKVVNGEIRRVMESGDFERIYSKWFLSSIPPKNINLNAPVSRLLKEFMAMPSETLPYGY